MIRRFTTPAHWILVALLSFGLATPLVASGESKGSSKGSSKASSKGAGKKTATTKAKAKKSAKAAREKRQSSVKTPAVSVARDERGHIQRSDAARHAFARQTGYPHGRTGWVIDHVVPLACGGTDAPSNMQ
jgi:D-alanine-D-alanine ligase-like ATP-grasp enzyme